MVMVWDDQIFQRIIFLVQFQVRESKIEIQTHFSTQQIDKLGQNSDQCLA